MSQAFEMPGAMRSRLIKGSKSTIGGQMLSPGDAIIKRISQPKIPASELAAHIPDIRTWLEAWKTEEANVRGLSLATTRKSSGGLRFTVPSSVSFDNLADYVAWMGSAEDFQVASARVGRLVDLDERLLGMTRAWQGVAQLSEPDFLSFVELLRWRRDNPDSRPPVRALAIPGLDSKWVEKNRGLVGPAFRLLDAFDPSGESDLEKLGFDTCDRMTVWFRCGAAVGGISRFSPQVALRPSDTTYEQFPGVRRAIVIENQTSFETIELAPGDIAIFGQGSQAPAALSVMPWLTKSIGEVLYWGDMDGEGYRILARARAALPGLRSILMDEKDVRDHMATLSVAIDYDPRPAPDGLTAGEAAGYDLVSGPGRRIEQERIPRAQVVVATDPFTPLGSRRSA